MREKYGTPRAGMLQLSGLDEDANTLRTSSAVRRCAGHRRPAPRLTVYRRVRVPQPAASRRRAKCRHATGLSGGEDRDEPSQGSAPC